MIGSQEPRLELIPDGDEHPQWDEVTDFLLQAGIILDAWQLKVLWASMLRRGKIWAAFAVGCCAPRQNGKNGILEARELVGAYILREKLQVHSAHLADTSMEGFRKLDDILDANEWLSKEVKTIRRANGQEQIIFRNGCRIRFRTRTKGGGRGFSASPIYFDESMYLPEISMSAMLPIISAMPDPQVWHMGSAVDQMMMDDGIVFARLRERALDGTDKRLAYFEWSLDAEKPDEVTPEDASDVKTWAATNPAFGIRITRDYIEAEMHELDQRSFAVERLGVGDWPKANGSNSIIDLDLWERLKDSDSVLVGSPVFCFDVTPDRRKAVIAAVGRRADGLMHIEIAKDGDGTGWLIPELERLEREHLPLGIVCDSLGPASSLLPQLEMAKVTVTALQTPEIGKACGAFYDAVVQEQIRHLGDQDLLSAIKGAVQRPLGDSWAWSRRNSQTDISPLVACTLGVWKVLTEEQHAPMFAFG